MREALALALEARERAEVPVGALIAVDNQVIARGHNRPRTARDATAHAEIVAIRAAGLALRNYRLPDATLYVTLEPCAMCAGAIVQARIARLVYGATDPRAGAVGSVFNVLQSGALNHEPRVTGGVLAADCAALLSGFFRERR